MLGVRLLHVDIRRCKSLFGLEKNLNMLKNFLESRRPGGVSYTFRISFRRVEYASNAFGARLRHASVRYMRVPIL